MKYLSTKKKIQILLFLALVLGGVFALKYFESHGGQRASPEEIVNLQKKENEDLHSITSVKGKEKLKTIEITSEKDSLIQGEGMQFTALLHGESLGEDKVSWDIKERHHEQTSIDNRGYLTLSEQETSPTLTIVATSIDEPENIGTKLVVIKLKEGGESEKNLPSSKEKPSASIRPSSKKDLKVKAQEIQQKTSPEEREKKRQEDKKIKQEAIAATSGGKKDKYLTDPTPAGRPKPVEPGGEIDNAKWEKATLSINCSSILDHMNAFNMDKIDVLPVDGVILPEIEVDFHPGESVYDILTRVTRERGIHMEASFTPIYNSAYVEGINNLYEFDCGELSGWMYKVNDWFPNYGCSRYLIKPGDKIHWIYTCELGKDIGDNSMAK